MALCTCDAFPTTHEEFTTDPPGTPPPRRICERLRRLVGPMLSPHMFPMARYANDPTRPVVTPVDDDG